MSNNKQIIRSVQRAIDILRAFNINTETLTLTEIAEVTGLAKSTATRVLTTLEENNFLEREPDSGRYRLGAQLYFLGQAAGHSISLKNIAQNTMIKLRDEIGETVNLYIKEGEHRVCIQQYESLHSVKHLIKIGQHLPLTVGASGKVLLAYQDNILFENVIEKQHMAKSKDELKQELSSIRKKHYSESIEERERGTSAIASPIFNISGKLEAALSISGPAHRFNPHDQLEVQKALLRASQEISANMGFYDKNHNFKSN